MPVARAFDHGSRSRRSHIVELWIEAILPLMYDEDLYAAESERARDAGGKYRPESLAPQYDEFFARVFTQ